MPDCSFLDSLVTPYVDGELTKADRQQVDDHVRACPPCRTRLIAEQSVHALFQREKPALRGDCASASLRARCAALSTASRVPAVNSSKGAAVRSWTAPARRSSGSASNASTWAARLAPLAL